MPAEGNLESIDRAVEAALEAGRNVPWGVCASCVRRLAATPGINMVLPRQKSESLNNPWFHTTLAELEISANSGCRLCKVILTTVTKKLQSEPIDDDRLPDPNELPSWARKAATCGPLHQRLLALQRLGSHRNRLVGLLGGKSHPTIDLQISLRFSRIDELLYVNPCALYKIGPRSETRECRLARASPFVDRTLFPSSGMLKFDFFDLYHIRVGTGGLIKRSEGRLCPLYLESPGKS